MDLKHIIESLNQEQKAELTKLLNQDLTSNLDLVQTSLTNDQMVHCPQCNSTDLYGHGTYKGRKRYKCKSCQSTFNDFTGTAISGIKKTQKFQEYMWLVLESISIRKAALKLEVNVKTIFDWRHKILSSLAVVNREEFSGIVECDDKQLNINNKGDRNLDREPYKRPSDRKTKRGVSNDKISIIVAADRKGNRTMQVAKIGRVDAKSIENSIGELISAENVLCSDAHPSIIAWAKDKKIEHHTFVATKQHIKDKCYHVQHVNSMDNLYERWIKRFYGVSTKYLEQYLNWFVFLEKIKKSSNQISELSKNIANNMESIKNYGTIDSRYAKLFIPQLSKT